MKVRCTSIINPATLRSDTSSTWIRIGGVYDVVEVHAPAAGPAILRVVDDSGTPSLWPATMFVSEDHELAGPWGCEIINGSMILAPMELLEPGFWEAYVDGDPAYVKRFEATLNKLVGSAEQKAN